jgi:uncharacterized protein
VGEAVSRDRDALGRPRNARPRDALGRPLARADGVPPQEDAPPLPPDDALRLAQRLLDDDQAFTAHEVFEAVWKATDGDERPLWRGLAQLAVGLTHRARGNERGAASLVTRGAQTLREVAGRPHGVPVDELCRWADGGADGPMPRLVPDQAADERA